MLVDPSTARGTGQGLLQNLEKVQPILRQSNNPLICGSSGQRIITK